MIPPYLVEFFMRSKVAWGGGSLVIVAAFIYGLVTEHHFSRHESVFVLMLAVIGAQFWHGLMQFEKMRPRFEIRSPEQHFWNLGEQRGSSGTGWYFEVFNPSVSESLECVRAELISIEPEPNAMYGILPFPLHIRHLNYCIAETFINPRCSRRFDLATGPDHNAVQQSVIVIPGIIGGDRGYVPNGAPIPYGRYILNLRVSARNCRQMDISLDLWVEDDLLRCVQQASAKEFVT
jgi:hypothetical protein